MELTKQDLEKLTRLAIGEELYKRILSSTTQEQLFSRLATIIELNYHRSIKHFMECVKNNNHQGSDFDDYLIESLKESKEITLLHIENAIEANDFGYLVIAIADVIKASGL